MIEIKFNKKGENEGELRINVEGNPVEILKEATILHEEGYVGDKTLTQILKQLANAAAKEIYKRENENGSK
jgi:hypothetical protein